MANEYNFFSSLRESDRDLFFGPLEGEIFHDLPGSYLMAHVLRDAGVFKSVGEARRCGWGKPIPFGFTDLRCGKNKTRITIFKERI